MKISELKAGMQSVDIEGKVDSKEEPREVQTKYGPNRVSSAMIKDDSGSIKLTLWGKQIDEIKEGDKISLASGYTTEWNGEVQVNVGRNGELKVL